MRLTVSKRSDLAIRAVRYLDTHAGRVSGSEIAEAVGTSVPFLSQVLTPLVAEHWIDSRTGPTGGYALMDAGRDMSLLELVEAIEGPVIDGHCVLEGSDCDGTDPCALHTMWSGARSALMASLADVRVLDEAYARI
jgi:Rrf2 family iron-sulfur cluster assembly transcriptional regulator